MKTLDPAYFAPKQFTKIVRVGSDNLLICDCLFASNFVFTWVVPIACVCSYAWLASGLASLVRTIERLYTRTRKFVRWLLHAYD